MEQSVDADEQPVPSWVSKVDRKIRLILLIVGLCIGFFIADVATPTLLPKGPFLMMFMLGVVTAQLTVICVWGTLVRGTFWIRLPWTLLLLVLSWCGFAWGITVENRTSDTDSMLGVAVLWMFGFITSFVPLKIAALCFRWQIVQDSADDPSGGRSSSYAIRDIMIGTLLLALTMAIGRGMFPGEDISFDRALAASALREPEALFAISIYGIVSLLVKLPCIWISLGEQAENITSKIVSWVFYCFILAIVEIGLFVAALGDPGPDSAEVFVGIIISHQVMGAVILGVCLALRGLGYRLERSLQGRAEHEGKNAASSV